MRKSKKGYTKIWVNLQTAAQEMEDISLPPVFQEAAWLIDLFDGKTVVKATKQFVTSTIIQPDTRRGQTHEKPDIDTEGLFEFCFPHIHDWDGVKDHEPCTEEEWEALPTDERFPTKYPRRTQKFFRIAEVDSENRKRFKQLVERDMMPFTGALFLNTTAAQKATEEEVFEEDLKNSEPGLQPVA